MCGWRSTDAASCIPTVRFHLGETPKVPSRVYKIPMDQLLVELNQTVDQLPAATRSREAGIVVGLLKHNSKRKRGGIERGARLPAVVARWEVNQNGETQNGSRKTRNICTYDAECKSLQARVGASSHSPRSCVSETVHPRFDCKDPLTFRLNDIWFSRGQNDHRASWVRSQASTLRNWTSVHVSHKF